MVFIPSQEETANYLLNGGTSPLQLSGAQVGLPSAMPDQGGEAGASISTQQTQTTSSPSAPAGAASPSAGQAAPSYQSARTPLLGSSGSTADRLFQPAAEQRAGISRGISDLGQSFRTAAGPTGQTFEGRGGRDTIGRAVERGTTEDIAGAKSLVGARYTGPRELSGDTASRVRSDVENATARAKALRSGYGLQSILSQSTPLTRGQARFEASSLMGDQDFRRRAAQEEEAASLLEAELGREEKAARELATLRAGEEDEIARRARTELQGRRSTIEEDVTRRVDEERAKQAAQEAAYARFLETGDPSELVGIQGSSVEAGAFDTPGRKLAEEARAEYERIQAKYGDVAEFDPLGLSISKRGREKFSIEKLPGREAPPAEGELPDYLKIPDAGPAKKEAPRPELFHSMKRGEITREQFNRLTARQKELEAAFAPQTADVKQAGRFAAVAPLYDFDAEKGFEESLYEAADPRSFVKFDPGVRPSRENVSTDVQREQFNRINETLEEIGRMDAAGEPYRAAEIAADVERYLQEEEATLSAKGKELSADAAAWRKQVKKARKNYERAKGIGTFGKLVEGMTGSEALGEAVGSIGYGMYTMDPSLTMKGGMGLANPGTWADVASSNMDRATSAPSRMTAQAGRTVGTGESRTARGETSSGAERTGSVSRVPVRSIQREPGEPAPRRVSEQERRAERAATMGATLRGTRKVNLRKKRRREGEAA